MQVNYFYVLIYVDSDIWAYLSDQAGGIVLLAYFFFQKNKALN